MSAAELVPLPASGRVFAGAASAGLGDVSPAGRARLDTLARWLQDVAFDDIRDAALADTGMWVVRRMRLLVRRFPTLREPVRLQTFCSGIGPRWAERRTVVRGEAGAEVDAVALWVHLDPRTGAPGRLVERYHEVYGEAAAGRVARGRLRHPAPPDDGSGERSAWWFRRSDLDPARHVNNAAYWEVVEERLGDPEAVDAEIEHRDAAQPGAATVVRAGDLTWICDADGTTVHASVRLWRDSVTPAC